MNYVRLGPCQPTVHPTKEILIEIAQRLEDAEWGLSKLRSNSPNATYSLVEDDKMDDEEKSSDEESSSDDSDSISDEESSSDDSDDSNGDGDDDDDGDGDD